MVEARERNNAPPEAPRKHQQFDERLESLDQIAPGAPGTSDATDICLESGRSLSGPDVVFCV